MPTFAALKDSADDSPDSPILGSYEAYDCHLNAIDPQELFHRYEQAGFLYPEKRERLIPYFPEIAENWRRALRGGELLLWVLTHEDPHSGAWTSVSSWRSTSTGWHTQHLVSLGVPTGARTVLLAAQAVRIHDGFDSSHQGWFTVTNRFPRQVFGSIQHSLGDTHASVKTHHYLAVPMNVCREEVAEVRIVPCRQGRAQDLVEVALSARDAVYVASEQLLEDDLELHAVDDLYRRVGLRRTRRVWLAYLGLSDQPAGAVLAYRGPLGLNLSFLENRCDLLIRPGLSETEVALVTRALIHAAATAYPDFRPGFIPVVADDCSVFTLQQAGAHYLRSYGQSIWLRPGYVAMYRHMENFYKRVEKRKSVCRL
ncbi:MAG: hypothetical protein HYZ50_23960 [Deltaproteobacteria bacterium]|nr:hypothetical protein [Deltaproteobacteria bacterium]